MCCSESASSRKSLKAQAVALGFLGSVPPPPPYLWSGFGSLTVSGFLPLHHGNDISNDLTRFLWGLEELA